MLDVRKAKPEEMKSYLSDKRTWKICESVHLGLGSIYLTFYTLKGASDEYLDGHASGIYTDVEKRNRIIYKFTLTASVIDDFSRNVLPNLPKGWFTIHQEWMEF